jgi:hypothetical protein
MLKDMKTSNKLLIAFAASLIVIPILVMVYAANFKYEYRSNVVEQPVEMGNFATASKNMSSLPAAAFQSVNIADAKGLVLNIHFVKDEKFGIKFQNNFKDRISLNVDANGQLQVSIKALPKGQSQRSSTDLYIYAPNTNRLNVAKANAIYLIGKIDSIQLDVKETGQIALSDESNINSLAITTANVNQVRVTNSTIKSLNLNMSAGNLFVQGCTLENLAVSSSGESTIELEGNEGQEKAGGIKNLSINTLDNAKVSLMNIKVDNCTGTFSDQTTVNMPAANLNQMYKNKK